MTNPLLKQEQLKKMQPSQQTQQTTTINLPRGNLDLIYQTNNHYELDDLLGFAQRINPKRAFLFVSKVLGRHIPVAPSTMRQAFTQLADLVPDNLPQPIVVVGMAETAVGLSAGVHQALQTRYPQALLLNSTRHAQTDATLLTTFSEDHSHASTHLIYQSEDIAIQQQLLASKTLIMVDDEASTGNTCINVVSALRQAGLVNLQQVHLTTLVDWSLGQTKDSIKEEKGNGTQHSYNKTGDDKTYSDSLKSDDRIASRLAGIKFQRHHLMAGAWQWTDALNPDPVIMPNVDTTEAGSHPLLNTGNWGRQPTLDSTQGFEAYLAQFQNLYGAKFALNNYKDDPLPQKILVLGSNEFVWLPFLLAEWLEQQAENTNTDSFVKFSALTRSPIAISGAIKQMLSFHDNYGLGMTNFAYNVDPVEWDLILLCVETPSTSVDSVWHKLDNVLVVSPE